MVSSPLTHYFLFSRHHIAQSRQQNASSHPRNTPLTSTHRTPHIRIFHLTRITMSLIHDVQDQLLLTIAIFAALFAQWVLYKILLYTFRARLSE